jgi:hypothetical protein
VCEVNDLTVEDVTARMDRLEARCAAFETLTLAILSEYLKGQAYPKAYFESFIARYRKLLARDIEPGFNEIYEQESEHALERLQSALNLK